VCGDIVEWRRFGWCSSSSVKICSPAAEMSAPESGSTDVMVEPFTVLICSLIVGAGSVDETCFRADIEVEVGSVVASDGTCIDLAVEGAVGGCVSRAQHTLAK